MYDPKTEKRLYDMWQAFEVEHGTEDTFREMLRVKRAVQAQFSQVAPATQPVAASAPGVPSQPGRDGGFDAAGAFQGTRVGFVFKLGPRGLGYYADSLAARSQGVQPDEAAEGVDVDVEEAERGAPLPLGVGASPGNCPRRYDRASTAEPFPASEREADPITQKAVPDAVFGSAAGHKRAAADDAAPVGALERFKRQK